LVLPGPGPVIHVFDSKGICPRGEAWPRGPRHPQIPATCWAAGITPVRLHHPGFAPAQAGPRACGAYAAMPKTPAPKRLQDFQPRQTAGPGNPAVVAAWQSALTRA
jgi:hypothetical protein